MQTVPTNGLAPSFHCSFLETKPSLHFSNTPSSTPRNSVHVLASSPGHALLSTAWHGNKDRSLPNICLPGSVVRACYEHYVRMSLVSRIKHNHVHVLYENVPNHIQCKRQSRSSTQSTSLAELVASHVVRL